MVAGKQAVRQPDLFEIADAFNAGGFGFGQGGSDAAMFDEAADQVGEHGIAMLELAAQLCGSFTMSHKIAG